MRTQELMSQMAMLLEEEGMNVDLSDVPIKVSISFTRDIELTKQKMNVLCDRL